MEHCCICYCYRRPAARGGPAGLRSPTLASGTVTEIDVPTGNILRNLAVDAGVTTMMIPPDGSHVYLFGDSTSETVAYFDTATGEFGTPIEVGEAPTDIDFTPDGKEALVLVTGQNGGTPGTTVVGLHVPADTPAFSARILPGFAFFTGHQL